jgi:hypothetical protein
MSIEITFGIHTSRHPSQYISSLYNASVDIAVRPAASEIIHIILPHPGTGLSVPPSLPFLSQEAVSFPLNENVSKTPPPSASLKKVIVKCVRFTVISVSPKCLSSTFSKMEGWSGSTANKRKSREMEWHEINS